ncbi:MAG: hypothetical protein HZC38_07175 [Chloroflexi bacterium]|nr:hypothetical protein [Chloroflexota bacterium]
MEAQFTKEMLESGVLQIGKANFYTKGMYFQAFTSLSTGLERLGKLCLILDKYIEMQGNFPDSKYSKYLKDEIGHDLQLLYKISKRLLDVHTITLKFQQNIDGSIYQNALTVLTDFALGDRYSNINLLVGKSKGDDPVAKWHKTVDQEIFKTYVSAIEDAGIKHDTHTRIEQLSNVYISNLYIAENGDEVTSTQDVMYLGEIYEAVAPYRQLFVLQIIRYWTEIIGSLQYKAMGIGKQDIPFFSDVFVSFYNDDSDLQTL